MTPKDKAKKLQLKYYVNIPLNCLMLDENLSKKMALIAVDEILDDDMYDMSEDLFEKRILYWENVKQEIKNL